MRNNPTFSPCRANQRWLRSWLVSLVFVIAFCPFAFCGFGMYCIDSHLISYIFCQFIFQIIPRTVLFAFSLFFVSVALLQTVFVIVQDVLGLSHFSSGARNLILPVNVQNVIWSPGNMLSDHIFGKWDGPLRVVFYMNLKWSSWEDVHCPLGKNRPMPLHGIAARRYQWKPGFWRGNCKGVLLIWLYCSRPVLRLGDSLAFPEPFTFASCGTSLTRSDTTFSKHKSIATGDCVMVFPFARSGRCHGCTCNYMKYRVIGPLQVSQQYWSIDVHKGLLCECV